MTTRARATVSKLFAAVGCAWSAVALFACEWGAAMMGFPHSDEAEDPCIYLSSMLALADNAVLNALGALALSIVAAAMALTLRRRRARLRATLIASGLAIAMCALLMIRAQTHRRDARTDHSGERCR